MPRIRTIVEIRRELRQKEAQVAKIKARRDKVAAKLARLDRKIALLGGEVAPAGRWGKAAAAGLKVRRAGRRPRGKALVEYLKKVLAQARNGMRVMDIHKAVAKTGYRSSSKDFYGIVATALREGKDFQRLGRGVYKLKG